MIRGDVLGGKELEAALKQLPKATAKSVLRRALTKAAKPIAIDAATMAPRDEGDLQESIIVGTKLKRTQMRGKPAGVTIYIGSTLSTAHLLEYGTANASAQPFMRPAWDRGKNTLLDTFGEEVWKNIAKAARTLARKAERGTLSKSARKALGG